MELEFLNNLPGRHIVRMPAGSRLYGTFRPDSDFDYRGVMLESLDSLFTAQLPFEQYEYNSDKDKTDVVIYGFRKFMRLALQNNPNILELLFCPPELRLVDTFDWREVYGIRHLFLSQQVRKRYGGYAHGQVRLIEQHQRGEKNMTTHASFIERYGYDTKAAAHLSRLINQACVILQDGDFNPVLNNDAQAEFMFILGGGMTYADFGKYAAQGLKDIDEMKSDLPEMADGVRVNKTMMEIYKEYVRDVG